LPDARTAEAIVTAGIASEDCGIGTRPPAHRGPDRRRRRTVAKPPLYSWRTGCSRQRRGLIRQSGSAFLVSDYDLFSGERSLMTFAIVVDR
jgi:hypothetical protein